MVEMVKKLQENPLQRNILAKSTLKKHNSVSSIDNTNGDEIDLLQITFSKITALMQLGFGEAGANIIASYISKDGEIDTNRSGNRVMAIFGFIKIHSFMDVTECLQEDVMVFVNNLGRMIHRSVHSFKGSVNKNIGDSFLLVWKLDKEIDEKYIQHRNCGKMGAFKMGEGRDPKDLEMHLKNTADNALISFLKIILDVKSCTVLKNNESDNTKLDIYNYITHPYLLERDWKLEMMLGLHIGWAIEGGIGSIHKIDASYLSPNVNIAARLEQATFQYGVQLLFSEPFHNCLSNDIQKLCRKIDTVTVKGSIVPIGLYTFDICNFDTVITVPEKKKTEKTNGSPISFLIK